MFPLRLVFLEISISMILSSAVFGGESPNDKIDTLLSVVYTMRDRMNDLVKNVGKIETKVNNIDTMEDLTAEKVSKLEDEMVKVVKKTDATDSKISSMQSKMSATDSKISSMQSKISATDSKINGMKSDVSRIKSQVEKVQKSVSWIFVGAGTYKDRDDVYEPGSHLSLAECLNRCKDKRSSNALWNGVRFSAKYDQCLCVKNDKGHSHNEDYLHFIG